MGERSGMGGLSGGGVTVGNGPHQRRELPPVLRIKVRSPVCQCPDGLGVPLAKGHVQGRLIDIQRVRVGVVT